LTSATFTFLVPRRLVRLDAYNGGAAASSVTLRCGTGAPLTVSVAANQLLSIATNWTSTCPSVTMTSSNGWNTNFDNLVVDGGP